MKLRQLVTCLTHKFKIESAKFFALVDEHELSFLWSIIVFLSGVALIFKSLPNVILETLPYDGNVIGLAGLIIAIFKIASIYSKAFLVHDLSDALGSTWLIYMGFVVTTAVPPMLLTGTTYFTLGIFINYHLYRKALIRKHKGW